jgi:hypothetical protein
MCILLPQYRGKNWTITEKNHFIKIFFYVKMIVLYYKKALTIFTTFFNFE